MAVNDVPLEIHNLNNNVLFEILNKCDYPTLKALAKTNKRFLALITQKFDHEAIVASRVLGQQKNKRLFIEKLYHLNSYLNADPRGITVTGTTWTKGGNSIVNDTRWYIDGKLHRYDGPAQIGYMDGHIVYIGWFNHGKLHRTDGPALEEWVQNECYFHSWYLNGQPHRVDGPAFIRQDFDKDRYVEVWHINGKSHRVGGPASLIIKDGITIQEEWFIDGKLHRENGPAAWYGTRDIWYKNGKMLYTDIFSQKPPDWDGKRSEPYLDSDFISKLDSIILPEDKDKYFILRFYRSLHH